MQDKQINKTQLEESKQSEYVDGVGQKSHEYQHPHDHGQPLQRSNTSRQSNLEDQRDPQSYSAQ
jgi:hypothetical protein